MQPKKKKLKLNQLLEERGKKQVQFEKILMKRKLLKVCLELFVNTAKHNILLGW